MFWPNKKSPPIFVVRLLFFSDDFVQAQQLVRWASEDVVSVVVREPGGSDTGIIQSMGTATNHGDHQSLMESSHPTMNIIPRDYFPSPVSTETESSESVIQQQLRRNHLEHEPVVELLVENTDRYPEYKH